MQRLTASEGATEKETDVYVAHFSSNVKSILQMGVGNIDITTRLDEKTNNIQLVLFDGL